MPRPDLGRDAFGRPPELVQVRHQIANALDEASLGVVLHHHADGAEPLQLVSHRGAGGDQDRLSAAERLHEKVGAAIGILAGIVGKEHGVGVHQQLQ
jgi:FAD/FMN-containing dehydrogenase